MKDGLNVMKRLPGAAWRKVRALFSLLHGWDDVRQVYGDNPNSLSDEERLVTRGLASNTLNVFTGF